MMKKRLRWASAATVVAVLTSLGISAYAEDVSQDGADDVAAVVASAAPSTDLSAPPEVEGDQVVASADDVKAVVPLSPEEEIRVTAPTADGVRTASIELPDEFDVERGQVADDGTVVYSTNDGGGDAVAVQTLADGATRIQTVIGSPSSAHEFGYRMDGYQPYQSDTGEVIFLNEAGEYIPIAAPWATDANGDAVETRYEVRGDELFQVVVSNESTAYPVVADPTWQWLGPAWGMKLTRSETSRVRNYAAALGMCALFTKKIAIRACGVFGSYIVAQANIAEGEKPKSCLFFTAAPVPGIIWKVPC
ncbi:hypothetical protein [Microbacterium oxydans]|uniref:hypothetical protein n=1 Tax=Microbacterium oxydans TaxID=82380 RepID=UPI0022B1D5A2|nr:hypothetical protein [Microbacterium oxydans]MCZ4302515.1 hypothetical protein [Microbacterium oxydans]